MQYQTMLYQLSCASVRFLFVSCDQVYPTYLYTFLTTEWLTTSTVSLINLYNGHLTIHLPIALSLRSL